MSDDVCPTRVNRPKSGRPGRRGQQDEEVITGQTRYPANARMTKGRESPSLSVTKGRESPSPGLTPGRASPALGKGRMSPSPSLSKGRASPSLYPSKGRESPSLSLNRGRASPSLNMGRSSPSPTKGRASPNPSTMKGRASPTKQSRGITGRPPQAQLPRGGRSTPDDSRQSNGRSSVGDTKNYSRTVGDTRNTSSLDEVDSEPVSVFITDGEELTNKMADYDSVSMATLNSGDPSVDTDSGVCSMSPSVDQIPSPDSPPDKLSKLSQAVSNISTLQDSLSEMFREAKTILTGYQSDLKEKSIAEFSSQVSEFSRTFSSLSGAYQACETVTGNISDHLRDIRVLTGEICDLVNQGAEREGIQAWVEETDQDIRDKAFLKEQFIAKQRAQEAKIQRIKMIYAKASEEVVTSRETLAQAEVQSTHAETAAIGAVHQSEEAVRRAEEARLAEEAKRKAEEQAKKRAEELQRKREEEERKRREEEEKETKEAAKRRGSSVDEEIFKAQLEREKREEEARNLNNWPRFIYSIEPGDFDPGIGIVLRSQEGTLEREDLKVSHVDQLCGAIPLGEAEELISNIINISPADPAQHFQFSEPVALAIPHCGPRLSLGREMVVKQRTEDGQIHSLNITEVFFDDIKELHFVQVRVRTFGTFAVFLRVKKENLSFDWRGGKFMSTVDSRVTVAWHPRVFRSSAGMTVEVQNVDQHIVTDIKKKHPLECEALISAGCIVRFTLPQPKSRCSLTLTLPCPLNPAHRPIRPKTARSNSNNNNNNINNTNNSKDQTPIENRPLSARFSFGPTSAKDSEPLEELHLLRQVEDGPWVKVDDIILTHPKKKDVVSFDLSLPFSRLSAVRTTSGLTASRVEKLLNHVTDHLTWRPTCLITRQKTIDPTSTLVTCCHPTALQRVLEDLDKEGYGHGPHPSRELNLTEGQRLELRFRGNVAYEGNHMRDVFVFNSHIPFRITFDVREQDKFAQKGFDSYRGFVQIFTAQRPRKHSLFPDEKDKIFVQKIPQHHKTFPGKELLCEHLLVLPKPDPETPRPLSVAKVELSSGGAMTEDLLKFLSQNLQSSGEWRRLAQLLNVRTSRMQAILRQNTANDTSCVIHDLLVTWSKRLPRALDRIEVLAQALTTIGRTDLAQELHTREATVKAERSKETRDAHLHRAFLTIVRHPLASAQWKHLARYLDVDEEEIEVIEIAQNTPQERCHKSLYAWRDQQGEHATVRLLADLLKSCRYPKLAKEIESIG